MDAKNPATAPALLAVAVSVVACTTSWTKPGVTEQEFERDKAACIADAYSQIPPAVEMYPVGSGYATPAYTTCTRYDNAATCVTYPGMYTPPMAVPIDLNASARDTVVDACMYRKGYQKAEGPAAPAPGPGR
jgi:hypothetical protein